ncbi:RecE family exodeoxyribonuclease [Raoultella ornithinolytica]|uniref:RecE family exodeoxyribonuclease n=1 Tax=Raoultella ornithinolytica TaxID=54291 RepID=UPI0022750995|nr:PD-(D/E)XK nuclease-like domain-containing protein [Raoultella ornithinolytica]EKU0199752.1 PD-(D/E)XK nuclease-like domain-containing protein [Raoultella ornithinolytica]EKV4103097.1 PD-(D/E)XK nuclease-like domain-containing protein [Raoultella ornithinolytica]EKV8287119.1 PD-(D/E)XK nuclease-like domain-containing protein [Raoultella ornithinolytica]EKW3194524.1 PD-(D/E)XK nuclease-like domain-containing protein [Raoultella ornithinolytica]
MEFFNLIKATQKSGKPDGVIWRTAKSESRANLQLDVDLEDAGIETGRGHDYMKPIRTDFPVFNDLPAEGVLDFEWCTRYELAEDGRTWQLKAGAVPDDGFHQEETTSGDEVIIVDGVDTTTGEVVGMQSGANNIDITEDDDNNTHYPVAQLRRPQRVISQFISDAMTHHVTRIQRIQIGALEMDTDNHYIQNLLLATRSIPEIDELTTANLWKLTDAVKKVFPEDKRTELGLLLNFLKAWMDTPHIDRGLLVKEWVSGNRITAVQRTDVGTNAGGGITTDRNPDYEHTLDTLDQEIALATLPMDFNIYDFPVSVHRRAKDIIKAKESPWKEWSAALRSTSGILDYSRASIFALIRGAHADVHHFPTSLRTYINANLTEFQHDKPEAETVNAACHSPESNSADDVGRQLAADRGEFVEGISDPADPKWVTEDLAKKEQPQVASLGASMFSIDGLMASPAPTNAKEEATSNVQMEAAQPVKVEVENAISAGESADAAAAQTGAITTAAGDVNQNQASVAQNEPNVNHSEPESGEIEPECKPVWPEFFEPGRYEGLPNELYHAANGISSTQIKDARISLMYFHARHVAKTIARESTDALTFGSLVHTLALEPDKFDEEFAVFPGVPAGAFTNTDTLKAFIRDYNADKAKPDQLKLTGKKEELQEAIRAVNPDAIFADEYEEQWRQSMMGKTIISIELLASAKAIQQALFSNADASRLLQHADHQCEVSYFGIDEETGLAIRVRPDIEIRVPYENICADLKTVTIGNVRQDRLKERLHREIIDRDYHLSAAMYCDVAGLDNFSWIFVNKEPGYHWVAVVQASEMELELGRQEYRRVLRQINNAMENDVWPAPIVGSYTDELNNYDILRLEALAAE